MSLTRSAVPTLPYSPWWFVSRADARLLSEHDLLGYRARFFSVPRRGALTGFLLSVERSDREVVLAISGPALYQTAAGPLQSGYVDVYTPSGQLALRSEQGLEIFERFEIWALAQAHSLLRDQRRGPWPVLKRLFAH
jgi:hypothetical protein